MQEINFENILLWFLIGGLIAGFLIWKISNDISTNKKASELRKTVRPKKVKVVELERSRYGLAAILLIDEDGNADGHRERFVPNNFTREFSYLSIDAGESGDLYAESNSSGSAAWLELKNFSSGGILQA